MTPGPARPAVALAVIDRPYRGAVEKQYFDACYLALELHRQLGGVDVLLRGPAACWATAALDAPASLVLGELVVGTLTAPRDGLRRLLDAGATVWCELDPADRHLPLSAGVRRAEPGAAATRWSAYTMVFFL